MQNNDLTGTTVRCNKSLMKMLYTARTQAHFTDGYATVTGQSFIKNTNVVGIATFPYNNHYPMTIYSTDAGQYIIRSGTGINGDVDVNVIIFYEI